MSQQDKVVITLTNRTIVRIVIIVLGALAFISIIEKIRHPLTLIVVAIFLAIATNPAVTRISNVLPGKKDRRGLATGIGFMIVLLFVSIFSILVIPPLVDQIGEFAKDVPELVASINDQNNAVSRAIVRYNLDEKLVDVGNDFASRLTSAQTPIVDVIGRFTSNLVSILTVIILTLMFLVEGPNIIDKFWRLQKNKEKIEHRKMLAYKMYRVITGYVNGQLIIATINAFVTLIVLLIVGVPNAVALAGIVGLTGLIPLIGASLGAVIVSIVAVLTNPIYGLIMAIYFIFYQQLENYAIHPFVQSRMNEMTPLLVFISALIGVSISGLLGAFIAIPIAGCLKILIEDNYNRRYKSV